MDLSLFNIYLLRHGALISSGILCGHTDIALSKQGWKQLENVCKSLPTISLCISSSLVRCSHFSQHYCQQHNIPLETSAKIKEMNFGDWDGKSYQSLWQLSDDKSSLPKAKHDDVDTSLGLFWQDPWRYSPPAGESMTDFTKRVDDFWQTLMKRELQENTLVVSHGGVIRHILARVLGLTIPGISHMNNIDVPYASLIHIQVYKDDNGQYWPKLML